MASIPLEIYGLEKHFDNVQALNGVNLAAARGEVIALVGANGAGKSTLLRCVVGSVRPDAGGVRVEGCEAWPEGSAARAATGWVLGDEHSWYWRLTGRQNLEVFGRLRGQRPRSASLQAQALLDEMGLADAADRRVAGYSTGMKARLGLARARLGDPSVIVLDEPSRGLDAKAEEQFLIWLQDHGDTTILMATHTLTEAYASDQVLVLSHGRVYEDLEGPVPVGALERAIREAA